MKGWFLSVVVASLVGKSMVQASSIPVLVLSAEPAWTLPGPSGNVGIYHEYLRDSVFSISDLIYAPEHLYEPWNRSRLQFGYTRHTHWLMIPFLVMPDTSSEVPLEEVPLQLDLASPYLEDVEFYLVQDYEIIDSAKGGLNHLQHEERSRNVTFRFTAPVGDTLRLFLRLAPGRYAQEFKLFLGHQGTHTRIKKTEDITLALFFGMVFVYLLLLGLAIELTDLKYFWYYWFYVLLDAVYIFFDSGLSLSWLPVEMLPGLQLSSLPVLANGFLLFGCTFVLEHFHSRQQYPFYDQLIRTAMTVAAGLLLLGFLVPVVSLGWGQTILYLNTVVYILTCVLLFGISLAAIRKKDRRYPGLLLVGFLVHGVNIIYSGLEWFNVLPAISISQMLADAGLLLSFHTPPVLMLGILIEMAIVLYIGKESFKNLMQTRERLAAALAVQRRRNLNAVLYGMESEQKRIARDLHDGLGGGLAGLKFRFEQLLEKTQPGTELHQAIRQAVSEITGLHQSLREIAHNLMPKPLYHLGLIPAIEQLLHRIQEDQPNLEINFYHKVDLSRLSDLHKIYLYRIVQELLANCIRHAQATKIWLQLLRSNGSLLLTIEDNGCGFDVEAAMAKNGMGLNNIRHRVVDGLAGALHIDSKVGQGTLITIEIPFDELNPSEQMTPPQSPKKRRIAKVLSRLLNL